MSVILGIFTLVLLFRYVFRPGGAKLITTLRRTRWLKLRKKDVFYSILAISLIALVEYSFPTFAITGLKQHKVPDVKFYSEENSWTDLPLTYGDIGELEGWLLGFGSTSKKEYIDRLKLLISRHAQGIIKLDKNIEKKQSGLISLQNENRDYLSRKQIATKKRQLNYNTARREELLHSKENLEGRLKNIDSFFGDGEKIQNYLLKSIELESEIDSKKELGSVRKERRIITRDLRKAYLDEFNHLPNKGKNTPEFKDLDLENSLASDNLSFIGNEISNLKRVQRHVGYRATKMLPETIFPQLSAPIEIISESQRMSKTPEIEGPKSDSPIRYLWKKFHQELSNESRVKYRPKDAMKCHVHIGTKGIKPSAFRTCEILLVVPINYDLTFPYCNNIYLDKWPKYKVKAKALLENACIEKWILPHLRVIMTDEILTIYEPISLGIDPKKTDIIGSPIGKWEVYFDGQYIPIAGKVDVKWDGDFDKISEIKLRHSPKENLPASMQFPDWSVNTQKLNGKIGSVNNTNAYIWKDFRNDYRSLSVQTNRSLLFNGYFKKDNKFTQKDIVLQLPKSFKSIGAKYLSDYDISNNKQAKLHSSIQSYTYSRLVNRSSKLQIRLDKFNKVVSEEQKKIHGLLKGTNNKECKIPLNNNHNTTGISHSRLKLEMGSLLSLVQEDGWRINCEKYDAVRAIFENLISISTSELF